MLAEGSVVLDEHKGYAVLKRGFRVISFHPTC